MTQSPPRRIIAPKTRKLIGTIALLVFITVYAMAATAVAIVMQVNQAGNGAALAYSVIAGLLWVVPAGALIWWMQRTPGVD